MTWRASLAELPPSARPCARRGYPPGIFEAKDASGLPVFFDANGARLARIVGPNAISDFQLRNLRLARTDLAFDRGRFYRDVDGARGNDVFA